MTDPALVERRHRMRRVVGGVMAGAVLLLGVAGVCSLARKPLEPSQVVQPSVPMTSGPIANAVPAAEVDTPPAAPAASEASPEIANPAPTGAAPSTAKATTPQPHRTKGAPRKSRSAVGSH
jgi:hypothetical protein